MVAIVYWLDRRWEEPEQFQLQVRETCEIKLGKEHPSMFTSIYNLVLMYNDQG
jgi:hypothetical protein